MKGEKIAVVGPNGAGKTTLCKMLVGELAPDAGTITWGHQASIGYLAQDHREGIAGGTTVADWLHSFDPTAYAQDIRALLGKMLFKGEEGLKPTDALSGGEAVRLLFAKLMLMKDNVLVLDEPTNHLDLESIVALGEALVRYEGTAFVVSHDRESHQQLRDADLRLHAGRADRFPRHLRRAPREARRKARQEEADLDASPADLALGIARRG